MSATSVLRRNPLGRTLIGLDKRRLRGWLAAFFLALAIPTAVLVVQAHGQLKWEAFHQYRLLAEELSGRIDARLAQLVAAEEARSFADYSFLVFAGDPAANFLQRSALSALPDTTAFPGLLGYFQVDARGEVSTPLLPPAGTDAASYGLAAAELETRRALQARLIGILRENSLVAAGAGVVGTVEHGGKATALESKPASAPAARRDADAQERDAGPVLADDERSVGEGRLRRQAEEEVVAQSAFEELAAARPSAEEPQRNVKTEAGLGRVADLKLDQAYATPPASPASTAAPAEISAKRASRKERSVLPEAVRPETAAFDAAVRVSTFESELDPLELRLLDSGHLVLFRKVWREDQRYIQGALIDRMQFLDGLIGPAFRESALSRASELIAAYAGTVFAAYSGEPSRDYLMSAEDLSGELLYQTRLSAPAGDLELIYSVAQLPAGPGAGVLGWLAVILASVLCGGFYLMYRLGAVQIDVARQQQDFVSAVSHELKTPLTSIRMYGEMLREGWAAEEQKKTYYSFIYDESERLSRLIGNVLQLARMTRNDLQLELKPLGVGELMDSVRSRVGSMVERAGFTLHEQCDDDLAESSLQVDADALIQIVINLVDNALKFSRHAERRQIDLSYRRRLDATLLIGVRDYGPGVPKDQMKKIFRLFYRSESELTRETVGTGIGLALVHELARAMNGRIDVVNREPGAEFDLYLPLK